ncbi:RNA-directed DNA polymerase from mobile element jockey [Paramuricea clavata]|uniref:RNA-directed DNA polymerase from mobile element jockey n=1 Tax=Paramuricea clavata TaxID=317549 RepID=A0A7D9E5R2_PARCT|nr:RNA-directed DNA polymerase from mobile element jockey [Paramuricea clavata]
MVVFNCKYRGKLSKVIIGILMFISIIWLANRSEAKLVRFEERSTTAPGICNERRTLKDRSLKAFIPLDETSLKVCKITHLQQLVHGGGYDVLCICETWLNDSIPDSEILPGYNIFRKDRANEIGGGVLVGIKSDLEA